MVRGIGQSTLAVGVSMFIEDDELLWVVRPDDNHVLKIFFLQLIMLKT